MSRSAWVLRAAAACALLWPALAVAAAPEAAAQAGLIDALKQYCVTAAGAPDAALKAAEADGFGPMPAGSEPPPLEHGEARLNAERKLIVAVGETAPPKRVQGFHMAVCMVGGGGAGRPQLARDVRRWLGFDPFERTSGEQLYIFDMGPQGARTLENATDEELRGLAAQGRMRIVSLQSGGDFAAAYYGVMVADAPAAVAAGAPPATTPFDDFKALCLSHRGQPAESLKAAEAAGWMEAPAARVPHELPYPVISGALRLKTTEEDFEALVTGEARMQLNLQRLSFSVCGLMQAPPADRTLVGAVRAWVGAPPADSFPGGSEIYLFVDEGGKRRSLGGPNVDAAVARLAKTGAVSVVVVDQSSETTAQAFVAYGVITKVTSVEAGVDAYAAR